MGWEVIDVFYEKRNPHWIMFRTRHLPAFKISCLAFFGRGSLLFINEYQVKSKALLENTWKSKSVATMLTC